MFESQEEQQEAATLFHTKLEDLEQNLEEKAIRDVVIRVKKESLEYHTKELDPTDMQGLQNILKAKSVLQELEKIHIKL